MPQRFGAHMSIAGGLHLAVERARDAGCDVLQVFTKNRTGLHSASAQFRLSQTCIAIGLTHCCG